MSDTLPNPLDFLGDEADEELEFEGEAAEAVPAPVIAKGKAAKPRRARRDEAAASGEPAIETPAPKSIAPVPAVSAPLPEVAAEEPVGTPAPFPPQIVASTGSKTQPWLLAIVGLALFSSVLSVGGLIAVGRTLAHADADRQQAAAERDMLARVPELVERLDTASQRLDTASTRLATASSAAPAGPPATIADVRHELDALKLALAQHDPEGVAALNGSTREGFSELSTKIDRITDQLSKKTASGPVNASR